MKSYVLGFALSEDKQKVVLIKKAKPAWQAGKYNGLGGRIEGDETPEEAMAREFLEEAGVDIGPEAWTTYARLSISEAQHDNEPMEVFVLRTVTDRIYDASTMEAESVSIMRISEVSVHSHQQGGPEFMSNLPWLIQLSLDDNYGRPMFTIAEYGSVEQHLSKSLAPA